MNSDQLICDFVAGEQFLVIMCRQNTQIFTNGLWFRFFIIAMVEINFITDGSNSQCRNLVETMVQNFTKNGFSAERNFFFCYHIVQITKDVLYKGVLKQVD